MYLEKPQWPAFAARQESEPQTTRLSGKHLNHYSTDLAENAIENKHFSTLLTFYVHETITNAKCNQQQLVFANWKIVTRYFAKWFIFTLRIIQVL